MWLYQDCCQVVFGCITLSQLFEERLSACGYIIEILTASRQTFRMCLYCRGTYCSNRDFQHVVVSEVLTVLLADRLAACGYILVVFSAWTETFSTSALLECNHLESTSLESQWWMVNYESVKAHYAIRISRQVVFKEVSHRTSLSCSSRRDFKDLDKPCVFTPSSPCLCPYLCVCLALPQVSWAKRADRPSETVTMQSQDSSSLPNCCSCTGTSIT